MSIPSGYYSPPHRESWQMTSSRLREFVQSFGPAWIVMIADVDAPSVITAAEVGAAYSYGLTWFFLLLTVPLFLIQEASGRLGIATGTGLGEVIRRNYSRRIAVLASLPMAGVDVVSYLAEYTGIAVGMGLLGVSPLISMPLAYVVHIAIIVRRKFVTVEKALYVVSTVLIISYAGSLFVRGVSLSSNLVYLNSDPQYFYLLAASAGAVVMPFMLFYQASATAMKGTVRLWAMRVETLVGAIASEMGMIVIAVASSGLTSSVNFGDVSTLSQALSSIAGAYAPYLFGLGLVAAAFLALVVISLASSWAVVEAMGWQRGSFFWVYVAESIPAVIIPIFHPSHLTLILNLMVAFVFVLTGPGILMGLLTSNRKIMGNLVSTRVWKAAYWLSLAAVIGLGITALVAII